MSRRIYFGWKFQQTTRPDRSFCFASGTWRTQNAGRIANKVAKGLGTRKLIPEDEAECPARQIDGLLHWRTTGGGGGGVRGAAQLAPLPKGWGDLGV